MPMAGTGAEVTADRLLLIDGDGNIVDGQGEVEASARNIHIASPSRQSTPQGHFSCSTCPMPRPISMIEGGRLLMAHQTAARFYGRIGYEEEFGGIALTQEEGERIARKAKDNSHIDCMFSGQSRCCLLRSVSRAGV